jgi:hypothetical protein
LPTTPAAFADRYLDIEIHTIPTAPGDVPGVVHVSARNYRNHNHAVLTGWGRALHHFLAATAGRGVIDGLQEAGGAISYNGIAGHIPPCTQFQMVQPFDGKGSPELFRTVLTFAALWLARVEQQRERTPTLQDFADAYVGLDCIGFVREYFLSEFPASPGAMHSDIAAFRQAGFTRRMSLGDVVPGDVVLPAASNQHIVLVSAVRNPQMDSHNRVSRIECVLAQSSGEGTKQRHHNGVHHGESAITLTRREGVFHAAHAPEEWDGVMIYGVDGVSL